ncbi:unnamed protein product [Rotaria socialis]|uniref:Uncharacterized protein n=1 Tax=Rotaria socialis TaxID=392032 RepID=A0A821FCR8_9BILA|nr:unnamed protein product [Rotaria socialis]
MLISYNDDDNPDEPELTMNSNDHYQQEQLDNNSAPIIMNIFDFFKSDFEQVKENEIKRPCQRASGEYYAQHQKFILMTS